MSGESINIGNITLLGRDEFKTDGHNPNKMSESQYEALKDNIRKYGFLVPIITNKDNMIADGEHRYRAALELGMEKIPAIKVPLEEVDRMMLRQILNKLRGKHSLSMDAEEFQRIIDAGGENDFKKLLPDAEGELKRFMFNLKRDEDKETLKQRMGLMPFSILDTESGEWKARAQKWTELLPSVMDARKGDWQTRKREWKGVIPDAGATREEAFGEGFKQLAEIRGIATVSVFDPVLAEVLIEWFSPKGGIIYDPFAGDTTQSLVAAIKGRYFVGTEIRAEQVKYNLEAAKMIGVADKVTMHHADAQELDKYIKPETVDFLFTCPPYYDLEDYSDLEEDLSQMEDEDFEAAYRTIIHKAAKTLKNNRFAAIVVGEIRDKKTGFYRDFVPKTIKYAEEAGLKFYNEMILITALSTLPLRMSRPWLATRKVGKTHQNILIFYKGTDPREWVEECGGDLK